MEDRAQRGTKNCREKRKRARKGAPAVKESQSTELLGLEVESVHKGRAIFRLAVTTEIKAVHGVVHGGILAALADTHAGDRGYYGGDQGGWKFAKRWS